MNALLVVMFIHKLLETLEVSVYLSEIGNDGCMG